jgi:hypothetical protein
MFFRAIRARSARVQKVFVSSQYLGMEAHRPEGLSGSTLFFEETFGTFPLLFEMIQVFIVK